MLYCIRAHIDMEINMVPLVMKVLTVAVTLSFALFFAKIIWEVVPAVWRDIKAKNVPMIGGYIVILCAFALVLGFSLYLVSFWW